jgi:hypothetical protein
MYRVQALRNSLLFEPCSKYSESAPFQDKGDERSKPLLPRAVRPLCCPEKPFFIEAETGIPLKCDFCGIPPAPSCVRWCNTGALELVEE